MNHQAKIADTARETYHKRPVWNRVKPEFQCALLVSIDPNWTDHFLTVEMGLDSYDPSLGEILDFERRRNENILNV